jgi:hypothetical protein
VKLATDPIQTLREWRAAGLVKIKRLQNGDLLLRISAQAPDAAETLPGHPVRAIFDHWANLYSPKSALDDKRRRLIRTALKRYTVEQLCTAIGGYGKSPYHRGQNPTGTRYLELGLMLRDSAHIEAGIQFATAPGPRAVRTTDPQEGLDLRAAMSHEAWLTQMRRLDPDFTPAESGARPWARSES